MPSISIRIAECACTIVRDYSAPKIKRLRKQLQNLIYVLYPEDARDPRAAAIQLRRAMNNHVARPNILIDFEGDTFSLRFGRDGWALYLAIDPATPPEGKGGRDGEGPDGSDGPISGRHARHDDQGDANSSENYPSSTLDTLISEREIDAICRDDGNERPAARGLVQMSHRLASRRKPAPMQEQSNFVQWVRALWAALTRSRTLVRNAQARQSVAHQARPLGSLEAAIPSSLNGIEDTGFELHADTVQVGPHLLSIRVWRRKSPNDRRQRRGLFAKKTHNKRLHL